MRLDTRKCLRFAATVAFATVLLAPAGLRAQSNSTSTKDQWIHVRVENKESSGETVRVNVPVELAVKVLPAINKNNLQNGKVKLNKSEINDVDIQTLLEAVRTAKDGEYVTVQSDENDVRVAKNAGYLYIHVTDNKKSKGKNSDTKGAKSESRVEIKVPMKVVDALFSAGKDELDIVAALHALSATGDTELVSVKDNENTVRVWIDSKNVAD